MEWHTHNDLSAGDPFPKFLGDRLKYGERMADEVHLADEWRYRNGKSYVYGLSNPALRPEIIDEDEPAPEVTEERDQREEYIKAKRARDRAVKRHVNRELRKRWTAPKPEPKPLIPIVTCIRTSSPEVQRVAPEPVRRPVGKFTGPMGLKGDALMDLLDE